ncbi:hypothetical protein AVEN_167868-1 [Araneus ventricosus]|uniref:Uncharacterized protein n=1 Tax=Araneus ventricosus TaxID=182803 RepID=A0A4Y2R1N6_ARAVE|nr:hypothetical protein AVEN_213753-1 [Araneus ventricosus]GBN69635.1 hypothetical protein AVEN_191648-1 [Araneus ventricosus]GBN69918.1 hypothetical protein AVEN_31826-1 [Araneus ventricosus]GBN69923.1 hypothetical protein AVEN_167868-1 [Araneus ventricosus]
MPDRSSNSSGETNQYMQRNVLGSSSSSLIVDAPIETGGDADLTKNVDATRESSVVQWTSRPERPPSVYGEHCLFL